MRRDILFPVGRLVEGSLTKPQTTNMEGQPLTIKSGVNAGQARVDYYFAVAIPKGNETSWSQTPWGTLIYQAGAEGFPNQIQSPTFAWKVKDGDSAIPNLKGKIPREKEGYAGHWIVNFSSSFAPKTFNAAGTAVVDPESIKLGHYVQVFGNVDSNGSALKPGVFINHSMVAHSGFGPEIYVGPDPTSVGFGAAPLPAGASTTPVAGIASPANVPGAPAPAAAHVMTPAANGVPYEAFIANGWDDARLIAQGFMLPPVAAVPVAHVVPAVPAAPVVPAVPAAPVVPAVPTAPNPAILAPPPPAPPRAKQMTPKAGNATYEQMIGVGWTDEMLVRDGYMTA